MARSVFKNSQVVFSIQLVPLAYTATFRSALVEGGSVSVRWVAHKNDRDDYLMSDE